jgi:adenylate cyclase
MRYNVACKLALKLRDVDQALETLGPFLAVVTSASRIQHAEADPDLDPVRDDPRFKSMISAAKQRLGMVETVAEI